MSYKIVVDSCGELTEEMKKDGHFSTVSLTMEIDGTYIVDDENFNQKEFIYRVQKSPEAPKSSCPSPEEYTNSYNSKAEHIYAVTLSSKLSGSYNSAVLGKKLYHEEVGDKCIHVFDSHSASVGETLIAKKVQECEEAGMGFEETVKQTEAYIESQNTYFVLETLDTLRKNGRLTGIKSLVASALNIKPVMGSTPEGTICQLGQARGVKKALEKMVDQALKKAGDTKNRVLGIAHCNCSRRAEEVLNLFVSKAQFRSNIVVNTAGISTMYANDGGIIVVI